MSKSEQAANRISRQYSVRVEYVAVNREYVVDCRSCFGAKEAEKMARQIRGQRKDGDVLYGKRFKVTFTANVEHGL